MVRRVLVFSLVLLPECYFDAGVEEEDEPGTLQEDLLAVLKVSPGTKILVSPACSLWNRARCPHHRTSRLSSTLQVHSQYVRFFLRPF